MGGGTRGAYLAHGLLEVAGDITEHISYGDQKFSMYFSLGALGGLDCLLGLVFFLERTKAMVYFKLGQISIGYRHFKVHKQDVDQCSRVEVVNTVTIPPRS